MGPGQTSDGNPWKVFVFDFVHLDVSGMDFPGVVNMFVGSDCEVA